MPEETTTSAGFNPVTDDGTGQITLGDGAWITVGTGASSLQITGTAVYATNIGGFTMQMGARRGISPILYFKYIKKKFRTLERYRMERRIRAIEAAFDKAVESGQEALGEKILSEMAVEFRESAIYAKGVRHFIEKEDLDRHKHGINGGHIADTRLEDYTRDIPKRVIAKKKKVEDVFDGFVVYHYWNPEEQKESKKDMTPDEEAKMRDPVLFGIIKETRRLYFIADWDDEYCKLSFADMIEAIGREDEEYEIPKNPTLDKSQSRVAPKP